MRERNLIFALVAHTATFAFTFRTPKLQRKCIVTLYFNRSSRRKTRYVLSDVNIDNYPVQSLACYYPLELNITNVRTTRLYIEVYRVRECELLNSTECQMSRLVSHTCHEIVYKPLQVRLWNLLRENVTILRDNNF